LSASEKRYHTHSPDRAATPALQCYLLHAVHSSCTCVKLWPAWLGRNHASLAGPTAACRTRSVGPLKAPLCCTLMAVVKSFHRGQPTARGPAPVFAPTGAFMTEAAHVSSFASDSDMYASKQARDKVAVVPAGPGASSAEPRRLFLPANTANHLAIRCAFCHWRKQRVVRHHACALHWFGTVPNALTQWRSSPQTLPMMLVTLCH
jgi:hypothetical protein